MAQFDLKGVITVDSTRAQAALGGFGNKFQSFSKGIVNAFKQVGIVAAAVGAGLVAFGYKSLKAFEAQENATRRLAAGILNVKSATDKSIQGLLDQASALQKVTRFSDEAIVSAQGILSTFQLNQEAIATLTPRLLDMAEGIAKVDGSMPDLEQTAMMVAKALGSEDVEGLAGALRRVGVIMSEAQMEILKTGTMQERLSILTTILDQNYQGLAIAMGETTAGKIAIMNNAFGELQETIGGAIATAITPLITLLTEWTSRPDVQEKIKEISENMAKWITDTAIPWAKEHWPAIKNAIQSALDVIKTLITFVTSKEGLILVGAAFVALKISSLAALNPISLAINGIILDIGLMVTAINSALSYLDELEAARKSKEEADRRVRELHKKGLYLPEEKKGMEIVGKYTPFQFGGVLRAGQPALVGETGPELFVPNQSGEIIPNNRMGGGITVNIGMYAGTETEKRRVAVELWKALKQVANQQNKSVQEVI
jgi:hypothetical protein